MAGYRYDDRGPQRSGGPHPGGPGPSPNGSSNDTGYWIITGLMLLFFMPVGVLMLVLKLFGGDKRQVQQAQARQTGNVGARTNTTQTPPQAQTAEPPRYTRVTEVKKAAQGAKSNTLITTGSVLTAIFGFSTLMTLVDSAGFYLSNPLYALEDLLPLMCFFSVGVGLLWVGLRKRKKTRRYPKYLAMIGNRRTISVSMLSQAMGAPAAEVRKDLEDMLDNGFFPGGYLDYGGDMLVISSDGLTDQPKAEPAAKVPDKDEENSVLAEIRAVNDAIHDPKLSAQIDRVGMITAKIFDYQKTHPEKSPQLHSFLSYYLPTTLKILRAYAQLEDQEIAGDNITAAMARIEGMMDKVVEGFEKQLDQLFQNDAMDITTDVQVLERMLAKDGLSGGQDFQLGL